jgi:hypothetical protein
MEYNKIDEVLISQINSNTSLPAHVARFYAHLVLLLKFMGKELHIETSNLVISQFVDVLINLNQFILAPYYLAQMSEGVRKQKFIQLLRCNHVLIVLFIFPLLQVLLMKASEKKF